VRINAIKVYIEMKKRHRGHGCLSFLIVVCCQVEVGATV